MSLYYLRIAIRALLRQKTYSITTLLGLSLGMTSCLLILLFVVDELSYDQYHLQKARIYRFATHVEGSTYGGIAKVNGPWGPAAKEAIPEIEAMTRFVMSGMSGQLLVGRGDQRFYESDGFYADSTVFRIFSYKFISGDPQTALTAPNSMVITKTFAQKYFGNEDALGQTLRIDNQQDYTVTAILEDVPSASHFTFSYLLSMASLQHPLRDNWIQWNQFYTYLLLQSGTDAGVVEKKLKAVLEKNLDKETANSFTPFLQPLTDIHLRSHLHREINANSDVTYIYVFSSIALLILAISCANFINLSTAQASVRAKEIGVRKVNGAVKKQLAFQFLTETFLLCSFALVLAQVLTVLALPVLNELTSKNLGINTLLDPVIIAGIIGITFLTAVLAGSYPALYQSALKPIQVLKGKWTPSGSSNLRKGLVVFQFGLSSVLVIGNVIILQQLHFIQTKPLGFDAHQVITIPIQADALRTNYETVKKELLDHPGVLNVSLSGNVPGGSDWGIPSIPEGFTSENAPPLRVMVVDREFVNTFGMEIIAGRNFSEEFSSDTAAYLINEEAARLLGWKDPLSKTISMPAVGRPQAPVVGVIKDFHFRSLHESIGGILFLIPPRTWYSLYSIKIDTRQTENTLKFIEQKWATFDPAHPFTFNFFDAAYSNLYQRERRLAQIVGYFTGIGIFLACLGLYSLASFTAGQRTKEIGIRKVIGASTREIVFMLSKQFLLLVAAGFVLAVPAAWWALKQWLHSFAYHVDFNILLLCACGLLSMIVALMTVGYRAYRAAGANPVHSLRSE